MKNYITGYLHYLLFFTALNLFSPAASFSQCVQNVVDFEGCSFKAIAHRGYAEMYPENTLLAIEEAFKRGIKYCEVDVAITSDDVCVLHHDPYSISRTTDGTGKPSENSLADYQQLDAGFWKSVVFKDTPVPTLTQALNLAQRYDAHLYLDLKAFNARLLANSLAESDADVSRMLPAITTIAAANEFRYRCPESPWVWFGSVPENPDDDSWYTERKEMGCIIYEVSYDEVLKDTGAFLEFLGKVHEHGAVLWVYTINNEEIIEQLIAMGVDGVETDRPHVAQLKGCGMEYVSVYPKKVTAGNWNFHILDESSQGTGSRLQLLNPEADSTQRVTFGNSSQLGLPQINEQDINAARIPAFHPDNGLFVYDNFMMEDDGARDYTYSVIMDIYISSENKGKFIALIQTDPDNSNDADFFIDPEGQLGTMGKYHGNFEFDSWQRIIFVMNEDRIEKYLNGEKIGENTTTGSRWSVYNNMAYHGKHGFLLFSDENNETAEVYLSALQIRNYALDETEAAALGAPSADGIPVSNTGLYSTGISNAEEEIVDWEQQSVFVKLAEGSDAGSLEYQLKLSYGAAATIPEKGIVDLRNGTKEIEVIAQDGSKSMWTICTGLSVDAADPDKMGTFSYYPNPCYSSLKIAVGEPSSLSVLTITGEEILNDALSAGTNVLNLSGLVPGIYFLKVRTTSGKWETGKLIVQH